MPSELQQLLPATLFCTGAWLTGMIMGFWFCLHHVKADKAARVDAIRLLVSVPVVATYLTVVIAKAFGFSQADAPIWLAAFVGLVFVSLFPKSIVRVSRDGFQLGENTTNARSDKPESSSASPEP